MGSSARAAKKIPALQSAARYHGSDESNESHEGGKSNEGHESHEGEEGLRTAGQASRLRWEIHEDAKWAQEDRLGEEQVWQDCKQEDASPRQGQPVDRRGEGSTVSIEDQRLLRDQEGFPALQQGKGALQKEVIRCGHRTGAHGSSIVDNT